MFDNTFVNPHLFYSIFMKHLLLTCLFSLVCICSMQAQPGRTNIFKPSIHTIQLRVDNSAENFPVITLGGKETLELSFDDLTHEYVRYTYKIEHCDYEGNMSDELFDSDYLYSVADEEVIDNYQPSTNTTVLYNHYSLTIPNARMRPLLSGNYRITVADEDDEGNARKAFECYFAMVDKRVGIYAQCSTDTEIDHNDSHQQLSLRVDCSNLTLRNPNNEIKLLVMQNRRFDNAIIGVPPTAQNGNNLLWEHSRKLIFDAGNEYRKMEILSTRYPGMHGESVKWFAPYYHYTIMTDYPRKNYLYDEDHNGLYVTRYEGVGNADTEADYVLAHFSLDMPQLDNKQASIYVNGRWTTGLTSAYKMRYDDNLQQYVADILLKCGYYNYMYLCTTNDETHKGYTNPVEGNYFQTENEYDLLLYYKPTGSRYWQLVGCITPKYVREK